MKYNVQKGDTLWGLSKKWGIPLEQLLAQVPESVRRDPRKLMPGMTLNDDRPEQAFKRPPTEMEKYQSRQWLEKQGGLEQSGPAEELMMWLTGTKAAGAGLKAGWKGYRAMMDDAARADANMLRYSNMEGRGLARDTLTDTNPVLRGLHQGPPSSIRPNPQRAFGQQYRDSNAGWNNNPLGASGSDGSATLFRPHPSRMGTSIGPNPNRGMVDAPARDINRAMEANPDMTLGELAGWLRNNPRGMTSLERDIESMQPTDLATWLRNNPKQ